MPPLTLSDVVKATGDENFGGIGTIVYWALPDDVLTWPALAASPTSFADKALLTGDFEMKPTKKFQKLYLTTDTGGISSENVGTLDAMGWKNTLKGNHPGNGADIIGFSVFANNNPLVLIVQELDSGECRVMGDALKQAYCKANVKGGEKVEDGKFVELSFEHTGRVAARYTGDIPLTPAA